MTGSEPFPSLGTSAAQIPDHGMARRRRKSSGLGQEIRAGDTGAPSLGTGGLASIADNTSSPPSSSHSSVPSLTGHVGQLSGEKDGPKRTSKRRKARSLLRRCGRFAIKHTWTLPLVLICVFLALYAVNPTESNPIHHFIFLSYKLPLEAGADPSTPQYGKGLWDLALVSFYTIVLSFTREFIMQEILRRVARYCGIKSRGKQARFMEQAYTAIYFAILGPAGMYVMSRTPVWYFNTRGMYEGFPHKTHEACFKFYYLFEAAYWAQQAIVLLLGMEKRRKDFKELVGHHIVSLTLIALSYRFHFTYMGLAVYITHDISDFFLATSKTLNYLDNMFVGPYFFGFMCSWIYLRHYLNLRIIWSILTEFTTVGPFEINWATQQYKCRLSQVISFGLLATLQAINLFWLFFIVRIAYRFVAVGDADDDRSEAEESELEESKVLERNKEETKALGEKSEATPLLKKRNGFANGSSNGSLKARPNGRAASPSKRRSAQ
ncbi:TLC domain-containing protein [Xylariales sp. AK1849]|nr:TLC domain-containing protein [Xylariales sp. AK1849]